MLLPHFSHFTKAIPQGDRREKSPPAPPPFALTTFSEMHIPVKRGQANILLGPPPFPLIPERERIAIHGLAAPLREKTPER